MSEHPSGAEVRAPDEHVGNTYELAVSDDGQIRSAERLQPPPSVWIGSWLDYNSGVLHGAWIDAAQDDESVGAAIQTMLSTSPTTAQTGEPAEDWGVFDYDGFGPLRLDEQESISWIGAVGRGIAEHGPAFAAYADVVQDEAALDGFQDDYLGHYESLASYTEGFADDAGYNQLLDEALPDNIRSYVRLDTAAIARDMQAGGDVHVLPASHSGVWIFAADKA